MSFRKLLPALVVAGALSVEGCAAVGLTALGVGGGTAAGAGVNHALGGISYKTFNNPIEDLQVATAATLRSMQIKVQDTKETDLGQQILAEAGDREIEIELESLTPMTTRMRVVAKQGLLLRDAATATEIILQTAQTLDNQVALKASR